MFEEEALYYGFHQTLGISLDEMTQSAYDWLEGAKYGFNKANGWHNLVANPNDLPKENMIDVWALAKSDDGKMMPYVANYSCYSKEWHPDFDDEEVIEVIYWKEIIPPKE